MSRVGRLLRQTLTIARRDFLSTVATPTFLLFLLAPLLMVSFGAIGGIGAASMADRQAEEARIAAIVPADAMPLWREGDRRLRRTFRATDAPPTLQLVVAARDPARQAAMLIGHADGRVAAVLHGPPSAFVVLVGRGGDRSAAYLETLASMAIAAESAVGPPVVRIERLVLPRGRATAADRNQTGFFAVVALFFLTLLLAGQAVGTMAEERANKVIEVLAAAVPLEAVFLGKLVGMFGVALLFVGFWASVAGLLGQALPGNAGEALTGLAPAVGSGPFAVLFLLYFTMSYLLLGAVFLGVGAQATTPREIQMLSLPITIVQVAIFALASAAASQPDSTLARVVELFPLSSPFAMTARAANRAELWPHALAVLWQLFWVLLVVQVAARAFRRGVLQSGSGPRGWWRRRSRG